MALRHDPARRVEQARRLVDRGDGALDEAAGGVRARVDVALRPRVDRRRPAPEEDGPVRDADGGRDVRELDVVEHDGAVEDAVARGGVAQEDGSVGHDGVDDRLTASALAVQGGTAGVEVETDLPYRGRSSVRPQS